MTRASENFLSMRIQAVWSEPMLYGFYKYESQAITDPYTRCISLGIALLAIVYFNPCPAEPG